MFGLTKAKKHESAPVVPMRSVEFMLTELAKIGDVAIHASRRYGFYWSCRFTIEKDGAKVEYGNHMHSFQTLHQAVTDTYETVAKFPGVNLP